MNKSNRALNTSLRRAYRTIKPIELEESNEAPAPAPQLHMHGAQCNVRYVHIFYNAAERADNRRTIHVRRQTEHNFSIFLHCDFNSRFAERIMCMHGGMQWKPMV